MVDFNSSQIANSTSQAHSQTARAISKDAVNGKKLFQLLIGASLLPSAKGFAVVNPGILSIKSSLRSPVLNSRPLSNLGMSDANEDAQTGEVFYDDFADIGSSESFFPHHPADLQGPSSQARSLFSAEWSQLGESSAYQRFIQQQPNGVAFFNNAQIDELGAHSTSALKQAIALTQFSTGRLTTPTVVVLIGKETSKQALHEALTPEIGPFLTELVVDRFAFNGEQPTVLACDLSSLLAEEVASAVEELEAFALLPWVMEFQQCVKALNRDTINNTYEQRNEVDSGGDSSSIADLANYMVETMATALLEPTLMESLSEALTEQLVDADETTLAVRSVLQKLSETSPRTEQNRLELFASMNQATTYGVRPNFAEGYDVFEPVHLLMTQTPQLHIAEGVAMDQVDTLLHELFPIVYDEMHAAAIEELLFPLGEALTTQPRTLSIVPLVRCELDRLLSTIDIEGEMQEHRVMYRATMDTINEMEQGEGPDSSQSSSSSSESQSSSVCDLKPSLVYFNQLKTAEIIAKAVDTHRPSPVIHNLTNIKQVLSTWSYLYEQSNVIDDPMAADEVLNRVLAMFFPSDELLAP